MNGKVIALLVALAALTLGEATNAAAASAAARAADGSGSNWAAGALSPGAGYLRPGGSVRVREVQRRLRALGFAPGRVDGLFGPLTEAAVRRYQRASDLATNGVLGARTLRRLREGSPASPGLNSEHERPRRSDKHDRSVAALPPARPVPVSREPATSRPPVDGDSTSRSDVLLWLAGYTLLLVLACSANAMRRRGPSAPARGLTDWSPAPVAGSGDGTAIAASPGPAEGAGTPAAASGVQPAASPGGGDFSLPRLSVVIPALNEAENLPYVLERLPEEVDEVILVDGGSDDGTPEVALRLLPSVQVVNQRRRGKGDALACGFERSQGDIVVMLDADGSSDPAEIPRFVAALQSGAAFAKGSRFLPGGGSSDITLLRRVGNRGLSSLVNLLFGTLYTDLCYGYNAFWRHCLPHLSLDCAGFEIETLMNIRLAKAGLRVREVPSFEASRIAGYSKLNARRDGWRVLRTIVRERWLVGRAGIPTPAKLTPRSPILTSPSGEPQRTGAPVRAWTGSERRRSTGAWTGPERRRSERRRSTGAWTGPERRRSERRRSTGSWPSGTAEVLTDAADALQERG